MRNIHIFVHRVQSIDTKYNMYNACASTRQMPFIVKGQFHH